MTLYEREFSRRTGSPGNSIVWTIRRDDDTDELTIKQHRTRYKGSQKSGAVYSLADFLASDYHAEKKALVQMLVPAAPENEVRTPDAHRT